VCIADLAEAANVRGKVSQLRDGAHVNVTEDRAAMHIALRAAENEVRDSAGPTHEANSSRRSDGGQKLTGADLCSLSLAKLDAVFFFF
jgi:glucose-6-phosphate isomerase